jgi:hypothetical protein
VADHAQQALDGVPGRVGVREQVGRLQVVAERGVHLLGLLEVVAEVA